MRNFKITSLIIFFLLFSNSIFFILRVHPMNTPSSCDISIAITGSGGAGSITAGELLLSLAGKNGCYGIMRRSFGPQIRGGFTATDLGAE